MNNCAFNPQQNRSTRYVGFVLTVASIFIAAPMGCRGSGGSSSGKLPPTFDGTSDALTATRVVATLDTPINPGQNAIWCATFQAAWERLQRDIVGEPIQLKGESDLSSRLNASDSALKVMPPQSFYAAAGSAGDGVVERIEREFIKRFPDSPLPVLPELAPGGFVAYAYLETWTPFTVPYFDAEEPMQFADSNGRKTPIRAFGIREEDGDAYGELRDQAKILFESYKGDEQNPVVDEFILDLCVGSQPIQLLAARIDRKDTLGEMIAFVEEKTRHPDEHWYIGGNDVVLVPNISWSLSHRFGELERKPFQNETMAGKHIDVAMQDIRFRLDRGGVELSSQAAMGWASAGKDLYVLDRPFLLLMKLRDLQEPFFALWVDNAEVLYPWD